MIIAIDCDDVLLDCNTRLAEFHNEKYGTSYTRNDVTSFHLMDVWGVTLEESVRRIREFLHSDAHEAILPVTGAVSAIHRLARSHELHVVTAREPVFRDKTQSLLHSIFDNVVFSGIHLVGSHDGSHVSKADVCLQIGASVLIDDALQHVRDASDSGITALLFDCPWNRNVVVNNNVTRVFSWADVLDRIS